MYQIIHNEKLGRYRILNTLRNCYVSNGKSKFFYSLEEAQEYLSELNVERERLIKLKNMRVKKGKQRPKVIIR